MKGQVRRKTWKIDCQIPICHITNESPMKLDHRTNSLTNNFGCTSNGIASYRQEFLTKSVQIVTMMHLDVNQVKQLNYKCKTENEYHRGGNDERERGLNAAGRVGRESGLNELSLQLKAGGSGGLEVAGVLLCGPLIAGVPPLLSKFYQRLKITWSPSKKTQIVILVSSCRNLSFVLLLVDEFKESWIFDDVLSNVNNSLLDLVASWSDPLPKEQGFLSQALQIVESK
ncbi:hypothetical protein K2173_017343 [Erythroxylum novogranatense]|uniref:Uncharacterized protein n=1 Tax=Erythroxylum novogranatense TaxID=1862640 RepID=A0AAV8TMG7_9ROSI|nr:hypothetical protein K2173_017343 [Erythroxylum novogranatense]